MHHTKVQEALREIADPEVAESSTRFFTGSGDYGEGDLFLGIHAPKMCKVAKKFKPLSLEETELLLHSEYHEEQL